MLSGRTFGNELSDHELQKDGDTSQVLKTKSKIAAAQILAWLCSRAHLELQDSMSQSTLLGPLHQGRWDNISKTAKSCILTRVNTDLFVTMRVQKGMTILIIWYVRCLRH